MYPRKTRIESAEWVLPGHPDKLCDAAVDAIVDLVRSRDRFDVHGHFNQCGLEAACVFDRFFLTGRIAMNRWDWNLAEQVGEQINEDVLKGVIRSVYRSAGYGEDAAGYVWGPRPKDLKIETALCLGPFAEGEGEMRYLSDDQAICIGYANDMTETNHLPPAHWLARRIARNLVAQRLRRGAGQIGPDGKVIVRVETDSRQWEPAHVSVSLHHHEGSDWVLLRDVIETSVASACRGKRMPKIEMNGAGMFVAGGPNGDNGQTGKKLVMDAYGPTVPIGGGAWSGKDFCKVDRAGGLLARALALAAVREHGVLQCLVRLDYVPGGEAPAEVSIICDGRPRPDIADIIRKDLPSRTIELAERSATGGGSLTRRARWGCA